MKYFAKYFATECHTRHTMQFIWLSFALWLCCVWSPSSAPSVPSSPHPSSSSYVASPAYTKALENSSWYDRLRFTLGGVRRRILLLHEKPIQALLPPGSSPYSTHFGSFSALSDHNFRLCAQISYSMQNTQVATPANTITGRATCHRTYTLTLLSHLYLDLLFYSFGQTQKNYEAEIWLAICRTWLIANARTSCFPDLIV